MVKSHEVHHIFCIGKLGMKDPSAIRTEWCTYSIRHELATFNVERLL